MDKVTKERIEIILLQGGGTPKFGIEAPSRFTINRAEIQDRIDKE